MGFRRHRAWAWALGSFTLGCLTGCGEASSPPWATTSVDTYTDAENGSDAFASNPDDAPDGGDVMELPALEHECSSHADCDDDNACTLDACAPDEKGLRSCYHLPKTCPGFDEPCLETPCDPVGGCTATVTASDGCCFDSLLTEWAFEAPGDEVVTDPTIGGGSTALWHLSDTRSFTGQSSYLFAIPGQGRFDSGELAAGRLTMPGVVLPPETRPELRFHVWPDVAEGGTWDLLVVHVDTGGDRIAVWSKTQSNMVMQAWNTVTVDLSAFAGASIWVSFTFSSVDNAVSDGEGIYLDDVWVWTGCKDLACTGAESCDDSLVCTSAACVDGTCDYAPTVGCCALDSDCFDSDHCTLDLCLDDQCFSTPSARADCCNTSQDCDDGDPCTQDLCVPGELYSCEHLAVTPSGLDCP